MTLGPRAGFAFLATALMGCSGNEPIPELFAIAPELAYSNQDVRVILKGAGLIPSFRIDPNTDQRVAIMDGFSGRIGKAPTWAPLRLFGWQGPDQISATLSSVDAEELARASPSPPSPSDVEITDPRGRKATLPDAFTELGMDIEAPVITVDSPVAGESYCPGATIHARFKVTDTEPGYLTAVRWDLQGSSPDQTQGGYCPVTPGTSVVYCTFDVTIDIGFLPKDRTHLYLKAWDNADQMANEELSVQLQERPSVGEVTPDLGPSTGGTDIIISGAGSTRFEPDSRAYFDGKLLVPNGGMVSSDGLRITGYTPPHSAGDVTVSVVSRLGEVSKANAFRYVDPTSGAGP